MEIDPSYNYRAIRIHGVAYRYPKDAKLPDGAAEIPECLDPAGALKPEFYACLRVFLVDHGTVGLNTLYLSDSNHKYYELPNLWERFWNRIGRRLR